MTDKKTTQKNSRGKPNYKIQYDNVEYSKDEQIYLWTQLVKLLIKLDKENSKQKQNIA